MTCEELLEIDQQLDLEKLLISKYKFYSIKCKNPQLRAKCELFSANHQKHYEKLLSLLK